MAKKSDDTNSSTKLTTNNSKKEVAVISDNNSLLALWQPVIQSLVTSKYSGIKDEGEAMIVLLKAHELGIGFGNAIPHIHTINGKAGIDIHIIKAILSKAGTGVTWKKTNDFAPVYKCMLYTKVFTTTSELPDNAIRVGQLKDNPQVNELVSKGQIPYVIVPDASGNLTVIDRITSYTFTRKKKDIDGEWITDVEYSSFTWSEAVAAGIASKDVWAKWGKTMLDHRAFTPGARAIASDLLMGNYSYDELLTMNGYTPSSYADDGTITKIINKEGKEIDPKNISG